MVDVIITMSTTESNSASSSAKEDPTSGEVDTEFTVDTADIIRLMLGFLTSHGLHQSAQTLRKESGIGFISPAVIGSTTVLASQIRQGDWGAVLRAVQLQQEAFPLVHEQVILELAETDQGLPMAYSLLQLARDDLDAIPEEKESSSQSNGNDQVTESTVLSKARSLEQRLAAISAHSSKYGEGKEDRWRLLYGHPRESARQDRRNRLADQMVSNKVSVPLQRLPTLLQQACKWQSFTGQLPWIYDAIAPAGNEDKDSTRKKQKKKRKHLDLVLGVAAGARKPVVVGESQDDEEDILANAEPIATDFFEKIKFGKSAVCEAATFCQKGLITASSDGLLEIWDSSYHSLNTSEFPYQNESVMGHDDPILCLALSKDESILASGDTKGTIKVWKLATGQCLRSYQAHQQHVTDIDFSADGGKILSASSDGTCREFGIVGSRILQELHGHTTYIHSCQYVLQFSTHSGSNKRKSKASGIKSNTSGSPIQWVVTSSADGTVRLWQQSQCLSIWQPQPAGPPVPVGDSVVVDPHQLSPEAPAMGIVLAIPHPNRLVLVPRGPTAYLVDLDGTVQQRYEVEQKTSSKSKDSTPTESTIFCAATVSQSWLYLCTNQGDCYVYQLQPTLGRSQGISSQHRSKTGTTLPYTTISDFGLDSTSKSTTHSASKYETEVSQMIHHPFKSIVGAFSNDKTQKKGILAIWK